MVMADRNDDPATEVVMSRAACASALEEIEGHFRRMGAPVLDYLLPGLTDAEMDALTEPHGFHLPDDVRAWWAWHNGALAHLPESSGHIRGFQPSHRWLTIQSGGPMASLDWALADRLELLRVEQQEGVAGQLPIWSPTWLKLTTFQYSWAVDMGADLAGSRVFVAYSYDGYPERSNTLQELLERWADFLQDGLIVWRPDPGCWDIKVDAGLDKTRAALSGL
jgi:hypothetical protein